MDRLEEEYVKAALGKERSNALQSPFSLLDSRFDHDACGVGFVASLDSEASHKILDQALTALARLAHRGATAADGKSSDGVGVMTAVPRALLLADAAISISDGALLGVGMLLLPKEEEHAEELLERCLASHDLKVVKWRDVPVRTECLGQIALSTMPRICQALIVDSEGAERSCLIPPSALERSPVFGAVTRTENGMQACRLLVFRRLKAASETAAEPGQRNRAGAMDSFGWHARLR